MQDEQNLGGKFECDVDMAYDFSAAAATDSLTKTIDYEQVYSVIQRTVLETKFYLLEALAESLATSLMRAFEGIERITVRVRKPHPPVRGVVDFVEVEVTRCR
jgi:dihydroneopterin aldolase